MLGPGDFYLFRKIAANYVILSYLLNDGDFANLPQFLTMLYLLLAGVIDFFKGKILTNSFTVSDVTVQ
jgi:hypothetical protein